MKDSVNYLYTNTAMLDKKSMYRRTVSNYQISNFVNYNIQCFTF
uniref:Uncharacterized protein n=1 Tax=Arundo donax TaxID=35708 RepID=A0A0A9H2X8_ARUDO